MGSISFPMQRRSQQGADASVNLFDACLSRVHAVMEIFLLDSHKFSRDFPRRQMTRCYVLEMDLPSREIRIPILQLQHLGSRRQSCDEILHNHKKTTKNYRVRHAIIVGNRS